MALQLPVEYLEIVNERSAPSRGVVPRMAMRSRRRISEDSETSMKRSRFIRAKQLTDIYRGTYRRGGIPRHASAPERSLYTGGSC